MSSVLVATSLLIQLLQQAQQISVLLRGAEEDGRDITPEELQGLAIKDDAARQALEDEIARQRTNLR